MTAPARQDQPSTTDGANARMRVRDSETARVVPIRPDTDPSTGRAHAIPRSPKPIKDDKPGKIRNFASQHVGEARQSLADGFLGQDQPQNLTTVAKQVTGNPATWFRVAVYGLAYLLCFAVDTNKRAAITATLLTLSLLAAWAISALPHT